jgi:hypothetical protein
MELINTHFICIYHQTSSVLLSYCTTVVQFCSKTDDVYSYNKQMKCVFLINENFGGVTGLYKYAWIENSVLLKSWQILCNSISN